MKEGAAGRGAGVGSGHRERRVLSAGFGPGGPDAGEKGLDDALLRSTPPTRTLDTRDGSGSWCSGPRPTPATGTSPGSCEPDARPPGRRRFPLRAGRASRPAADTPVDCCSGRRKYPDRRRSPGSAVRAQPNDLARSVSWYWRSLLSGWCSTWSGVDCRTYTTASRLR
jgi:hypothetical protein